MSELRVNAVTDETGGNTATINSMTPTADSLQGFRNRLINSDMRIDQRNAGAAVTPLATGTYTLDRWKLNPSQASKITVQQTPSATETGYATRVGAGFSSYLACTTASAATVGAADYFQLSQAIEGLNISDLAWGTASAQSITLSFWVYSSLTGTFGGSLSNSGQSVGYAFSYSIPSANTWTKITLTIPGPTTGTWLTTNGIGVLLIFNLGCGSNYFGTANTWLTQNYINSPSGCVNVVATNGATFYITGVQLEAGSVATPFERRPYGTELALCQRYFYTGLIVQYSGATTGAYGTSYSVNHPMQMRAAPTITFSSTAFVNNVTSISAANINESGCSPSFGTNGAGGGTGKGVISATAEL